MSSGKTCRCCGDKNSTLGHELQESYGPPHESITYSVLLSKCFGISLSREVESRHVCTRCALQLTAAWRFKRQVEHVETALVQLAKRAGGDSGLYGMRVEKLKTAKDDDSYFDDISDSHETQCDTSLTTQKIANAEHEAINDSTLPLSNFVTKDKMRTKFTIAKCTKIQRIKLKKNSNIAALNVSDQKNAKSEVHFSKMGDGNVRTAKIAMKGKTAKRGTKIFTPISFKGITVKPKTYNLQPIRTSVDVPRPNHEGDPSFKTIANAALIIEFSNACPFKVKYNEYFCLYCNKSFYEPEKLREHSGNDHKPTGIKNLLRSNHLTKIDITQMECKLCTEQISDLKALKDHLTKEHEKNFYTEEKDGVLPFKLSNDNIQIDNIQCALCEKTFPYFHAVNQHMNKHFPNYVCETCGLGFVEESRLQVHKSKHDTKVFTCEMCEKEFRTAHAKKSHVERVHDRIERFHCPYCPERFVSHLKKLNHLEIAHGKAKQTFPCTYCQKSFSGRRLLTLHTRKEHLQDFRFECTYCGRKFFTKTLLGNHLPTHTGERNHRCSVCGKAYPREKALKEHLRIHSNDRRFACQICGQTFVQNGSLKSHVKSHHPECSGV